MARPRTPPGRRLLPALVAVTAVAVAVAVGTRPDDTRIPEGVRVAGVDIGGLEVDVARSAVERRARADIRRGVVVSAADDRTRSVRLNPAALGAEPLIEEALRDARRAPSLARRALGLVGRGEQRDVPLRYAFDTRRLDVAVARALERIGTRPRPATVAVAGGAVRVVPGRGGFGIDEGALRARLPALPERVTLPRTSLPPPVDIAAARRARAQAAALIARPPRVSDPDTGRVLRLDGPVIRDALRFAPRPPEVAVSVDPAALAPALREAFGSRERTTRDADLGVAGGRVRVTPDRPGRVIDVAGLAKRIVDAAGGIVPLQLTQVPAARTADDLRALNVDAVVSDVRTEYSCCEPRVTNIRRAAQILDGTVLDPGETFSMNDALGERTVERGFVAAPQISDGRFEEGVGGGVSQVATTLFNAAFFAGLELVAHTPHEVYISRYPAGREATISWGGPDLVFRNDWDAPVFIDVTAGDTQVRVRMFSRSLGRRVETETGEPGSYVEPEILRTPDAELEPGTEVVDQPLGGAGFTVSYTRRVYRGNELVRNERRSWTYRPVDARVRVGPEAPATTDTETGATTPTEPAAGTTPEG